MEKEELIKQLEELAEMSDGDEEVAHIKADKLLLNFINDKKVTDAFESIERWYA